MGIGHALFRSGTGTSGVIGPEIRGFLSAPVKSTSWGTFGGGEVGGVSCREGCYLPQNQPSLGAARSTVYGFGFRMMDQP